MTRFLTLLAFSSAALLLALLPFHAFLYTFFKSFFWTDSWTLLIQLWKELLLALTALFALPFLFREPARIFHRGHLPLLALIALTAAYLLFAADLLPALMGARSILLLFAAYGIFLLFSFRPSCTQSLVTLTLAFGGSALLIALLAYAFLPADFLTHFGYSSVVSTWAAGGNLPAYHLVGETGWIRLQGTFSGPNQLGAYAAALLPLAVARLFTPPTPQKKHLAHPLWRVKEERTTHRLHTALYSILILIILTALIYSFSRAALLAVVGQGIVFLLITCYRRYGALPALLSVTATLTLTLALLLAAVTHLPDLRDSLIRTGSSTERLHRLHAGIQTLATHPFGTGLGTTAGAAQRTASEDPLTPENTYLGIAIELGILGGILFCAAFLSLLVLAARTHSPLFYSLLGTAIIMLFLHPLEDAPLALTLGTLLGITASRHRQDHKHHLRTSKANPTT